MSGPNNQVNTGSVAQKGKDGITLRESWGQYNTHTHPSSGGGGVTEYLECSGSSADTASVNNIILTGWTENPTTKVGTNLNVSSSATLGDAIVITAAGRYCVHAMTNHAATPFRSTAIFSSTASLDNQEGCLGFKGAGGANSLDTKAPSSAYAIFTAAENDIVWIVADTTFGGDTARNFLTIYKLE